MGSTGLTNGKHDSAVPRGDHTFPSVPICQLSPAVCPASGLCRSALPTSFWNCNTRSVFDFLTLQSSIAPRSAEVRIFIFLKKVH